MRVKLLPLLVGTLMATLAQAGPHFSGVPLVGKDVPFSAIFPHLMDKEGYGEYWEHRILFDDQGALFVRVLITNIGVGDHKAGVLAAYIPPKGEVIQWKQGKKADNWTWKREKGSMAIAIGSNSLVATPQSLTLKLDNSKEQMDVTLTNEVPPWRPGRIPFGQSGFYDLTVQAPRARVKATLTTPAGQTNLKGWGYADHSYSNMVEYERSIQWFYFTALSGPLSLNLSEFTMPVAQGGHRVSWLLGAKGGDIQVAAKEYAIKLQDGMVDKKAPGQYRVPTKLTFEFKSPKGELTGSVQSIKMLHRLDLLSDMTSLERFVVQRFANPIQYRMLVRWKTESTLPRLPKSASGLGLLEFIQINP